ncbi:MAG: peptidylprolyl isomerase [Bryobacteraceae bacterium]
MSCRFVVFLAVIGCFALRGQVTESTAVIEASGMSMTKAEFERLLNGDERYRAALGQPASKRELGGEFGKAFALEAEARRRKIEQSTAVQLKIRNYTQQLLAHELLVQLRENYLKDEKALASHYEKQKQSFAQPRVRQILVRSMGSPVALRAGLRELSVEEARAKANALRTKLVGGADFAAIAKAESDEMGSRDNGGDIGFITRGSTGANFEAAAFSLPVGKLSDVIHTEYGFHILRVEERRPMPLESVKATIANEMAHKDMDAIILKGYKLNEAYFGK